MKPHEHLAKLLMEAGLHEMSLAAAQYRYHDFRSPLDMPAAALDEELGRAMLDAPPERHAQIQAIRTAHRAGEFDATTEESEEWASSPEGQEAFGRLARGD